MRIAAFVVGATLVASSLARAQGVAWPTEGPPRPLPAHDVAFPPYDVQTLANGLKVVAVVQHEQPAVTMRLLVRAGSAADPLNKLGLAHLTTSLLDQGTTTQSAEQIADSIDFIGGAEGTGAGTDLSYLNVVVMKDSFDFGMRLLSEMTRHPAFSAAEIDRQRRQMLSGIQVSEQDPSWVANAVFDRLVYGFHPYGMPDTGTPETIAAITRDDLVAFHAKYFAPNNAILAVVGDVTVDEAVAEAKKVFGDWEEHAVVPDRSIDPPDATRRLIVVDKPDAVQTEVRVGNLGIPRTSPDYMATNLAIRILGGEGSNRLHQVLRTERGLTYGAEADFDTLKQSGDIEAQTNTRSEATAEVLRLIIDEFWRLQNERVSERELGDAKAYLTGSFPLTIETPDQIALQVLNHVFYDLPLDELQNFRDRVNAVTTDDVQRVARLYLKPDRLSVVLVGNAAAFASRLKSVGFGRFETIELSDLDLTAPDFKRAKAAADRGPGGPEGARVAGGARRAGGANGASGTFHYSPPGEQSASARADDGAAALVDRVVAAKGGDATLRGVRRIKAVSTGPIETPNGQVTVETTTYLEYPNHVRVETRFPDATVVQVFDGQHAWVRDPSGVHDLPADAVRQIVASLKRDTIAALVAARDGTLHARRLPDVKTDAGGRQQALELSSVDLDPMIMYVDPATGLVARQTYAAGPGAPIIEEAFSDYRPVSGVQVAFSATVSQGGQQILQRQVRSVVINPPADRALFTRPEP